jgi:hypothetical protein
MVLATRANLEVDEPGTALAARKHRVIDAHDRLTGRGGFNHRSWCATLGHGHPSTRTGCGSAVTSPSPCCWSSPYAL